MLGWAFDMMDKATLSVYNQSCEEKFLTVMPLTSKNFYSQIQKKGLTILIQDCQATLMLSRDPVLLTLLYFSASIPLIKIIYVSMRSSAWSKVYRVLTNIKKAEGE